MASAYRRKAPHLAAAHFLLHLESGDDLRRDFRSLAGAPGVTYGIAHITTVRRGELWQEWQFFTGSDGSQGAKLSAANFPASSSAFCRQHCSLRNGMPYIRALG